MSAPVLKSGRPVASISLDLHWRKQYEKKQFTVIGPSICIHCQNVVRAEHVRPNVLFIAADDMNCDLGVYGDPLVKNTEPGSVGKNGCAFDNAYCQQPLCGPSRASLMTGLRPDTLDMHTLKHELRQKNPDVVTLASSFGTMDTSQLEQARFTTTEIRVDWYR